MRIDLDRHLDEKECHKQPRSERIALLRGSANRLFNRNLDLEYKWDMTPDESLKYGEGVKAQLDTIECLEDKMVGDVFHDGLKGAIDAAYFGHKGLVLSPDMVWFMLLCEIVNIVEEKTEWHRCLFSKSKDAIEVCCDFPFNPESVVEQLKPLIPCEADVFLPKFTTADTGSKLATSAAFCQLVSPYYTYACYVCGIRFIDILGTKEDWDKLWMVWNRATALLHPQYKEYYKTVSNLLRKIVEHIPFEGCDQHWFEIQNFWNGIRNKDGCCDPGPNGWIRDLLFRKREGGGYSNGISNIATVKFTVNGANHALVAGLLGSNLIDGAIHPQFSHLIYKVK